ncbi:uncharacterized protein LOC134285670 [Aedes albopictus]|uniref:CCHC-type domain-containing protein n=1 Tax=Aedes albopictus TaxID=7160 RepID=A0ABM1Z9U4_AEDAL
MDVEFEIQYKRLMVHHLEKHEIEHELAIRAVQFESTESRSAIQRRLRDRLKEEKDMPNIDIDFLRCKVSVDAEIKVIDANVNQIRSYLENVVRFEGLKDSLKSRLVHYFARVRRAQEYAESDEDLSDCDELVGAIRGLMNTHFSIFSPLETVRQEVLQEIARSVTSMRQGSEDNENISNKAKKTGQKGSKNVERGVQESSKEDSEDSLAAEGAAGPSNHSKRRELLSVKQTPGVDLGALTGALSALYPFGFPPDAYGRQRQVESPNASRSEKVIRKFSLSKKSKSKPSQQAETSDSVAESDSESSTSSSDPPVSNRRKNRSRRVSQKYRPVSEWNIRYDGKDNGQNLMKFLREVEFYAKSENVSKRELFRSAIYLFKDQAKSWYMSGVENEDFANWNELVAELKREFLSPDHDHVTEIKAISRKQGPKERFTDYFSEMQKIFNSLTKPISEGKKFEIINRNLRSDYKGHAVASNIDNLADLKRFGRQLDATYWYKYAPNTQDQNATRNRTQVNEVSREPPRKPKHTVEDQNKTFKSRSFYRSSKEASDEDRTPKKPPRENPKSAKPEQKKTDNPRTNSAWLDRYVPPTEGTCFNCRRQGHHHSECTQYRYKFCLRCGLHEVETKNCPYCEKNFR